MRLFYLFVVPEMFLTQKTEECGHHMMALGSAFGVIDIGKFHLGVFQAVLPYRCSCREHGLSIWVIDLRTGHKRWRCVVGNTRETWMPVPCNGLHFPSRMVIGDQVISSSSDEIVADTSAPIVEPHFQKRALRNAPILPCR